MPQKTTHWAKMHELQTVGYSQNLETTKISSPNRRLNEGKYAYTF